MKHLLKDVLKVLQLLLPQSISATTASTGVDMQDFESVTFLVNVGALTGTPSGSAKLDLIVQDSDVDVDGSYAAVTNSDDVFVGQGSNAAAMETAASGIAKALDAAGDASQCYAIGYRGSKRYSRINTALTGTLAAVMSVSAIKGNPKVMPPL